MSAASFIAIDLGASSGRVVAGEWSGSRFALNELHRFENESVYVQGSAFWDILRIWAEVKLGLQKYCGGKANTPKSISVDAWGVDYALLDFSGQLLSNPHSYRDGRTRGIPEIVHAHMPDREIFRQTGVSSMAINTLYQLYSMVLSADPQLANAKMLLMIPDLIRYWLCGDVAIEYTVATTTQMFSPETGMWAHELLSSLAIPIHILPAVVDSYTTLSQVCPRVTEECGFTASFPVIAGASHDTASAVAAIPGMDSDSAFISSGTWSLMGVELSAPLQSDAVFAGGFTNEGGANGSTLLVKNITGLWILQECLRQWQHEGVLITWSDVTELAAAAKPLRSLIEPDAAVFRTRCHMPRAIQEYCRATGQPVPETAGEIARCAFEGLSLKYRFILTALEKLIGRRLAVVRIVGGGSLNRFLCQMTADACNRPVICGPVEASAFGSVVLQAVATGHLSTLAEGRAVVGQSVECLQIDPRPSTTWDDAHERFSRRMKICQQ